MQVAIITGEASGDRAGAQLAMEIKRLRPDAVIWGTGGKHLREAGVELLVDTSRWGVIGIAAAVPLFPKMFAALQNVRKELLRRKPDVLVPIDAGAVNLGFAGIEGICPWTRKHLPDTRILYYFPPGSWRPTLKGSSLARITDKVATPFPWSETELRRFGVDAVFVGHPLLDSVKPSESGEDFADRYGINREQPVVALLPGSRLQEIANILPVQLAAASIIHQRVAGVQFVIPLAPTVDREVVIREVDKERNERQQKQAQENEQDEEDRANAIPQGSIPIPVEGGKNVVAPVDINRQRQEWLKRAIDLPPSHGDFPLVIVEDRAYDVMAISDVLLITSGTATLEAAILGKPMVITYRLAMTNLVNQIQYLIVKNNLPEHFGMPNILAGREICPEYIQDEATPEALADEIISLLLEPDRMLHMKADLQEAIAKLGEPGGAARTAKMVVELAEQNRE